MISYDLNRYGLDDSQVRISVQTGTAFSLGWSVRNANVPSLAGGNLTLSKAQKNARTIPLEFMVYGTTDSQLDARLGALYNLLDQPTLTLGRTVDGSRTEAVVELVSVQDQAEYDAGSKTAKTSVVVSLNGVYWRDEEPTTASLVAGSQNLSDFTSSTAPIADCRILITGAATPLTAFSIQDDNSGSGIAWSAPEVEVGQYKGTLPFDGLAGTQIIAIATDGTYTYVAFKSLLVYGVNKYLGSALVGWVADMGTADGQVRSISDIAVTPDGYLFVLDDTLGRYQIFGPGLGALTFLRKWGTSGSGSGQLNAPKSIDVHLTGAAGTSATVYIADTGNNRLTATTYAGTLLSTWGSAGTGDGQFNQPTAIAVDSAGNVFVGEGTGARVQMFNNNFAPAFVRKWSVGSAARYLTLHDDGSIFVASPAVPTVKRYTAAATAPVLDSSWGSSGAGAGQLTGITGMCLSLDRRDILLADTPSSGRVQKFEGDGIFDGVPAGEYLLIDVATRRAYLKTTADFELTGDSIAGLSTVRWGGKKVRLSPAASPGDLFTRVLAVTVAQTGGAGASLQALGAHL